MSYFDHVAASVGLPAKIQPITTYKRDTRSEFTANDWLRNALVRK